MHKSSCFPDQNVYNSKNKNQNGTPITQNGHTSSNKAADYYVKGDVDVPAELTQRKVKWKYRLSK